MSRSIVLCVVSLLAILFAISCSSGGTVVAPSPTDQTPLKEASGTTGILGFWQVVVDRDAGTIEAVDLRDSDLIVNVLGFLEPPALKGMTIDFATLVIGADTVKVDVILKHPIPSAEFMGFDVRGVVFGPKVTNADGLTIIPSPEFFTGVPFGYQNGLLGAPDSAGNYSGLAGYKYFADGLGMNDDLATFMSNPTNLAKRGVFKQSTTLKRHYDLDWADVPQALLVFNYAIYANYDWPVGDPVDGVEDFDISTANSAEAFCAKVTELANSLWAYGGSGGGSISLMVEIWDWQGDIADVTVEAPGVIAKKSYDVISGPGTAYSTNYDFYAVPGTPTVTGDLDIIITATDPKTFGESWFLGLLPTGNSKYSDPIYNCFIHTATVAANGPPEITSGVDGNDEPFEMAVEQYSVTAIDPQGDPITYSWTLTDVESGYPVSGYDGVAGNGGGTIDIDFGDCPYAWALAGTEFELDCEVSDGIAAPANAETLEIKVTVDGDIWVSNHADFASVPDKGTKAEPYSTPAQAFAAILSNPAATIVVDYGTGTYDLTGALSHSGATYDNVTWRGYSWYTDPGGRPKFRKMHTSSYAFYINGCANFMAQGLKFEFNPAYSGNNMFYTGSNPPNPTVRDCVFTGQNNSTTCQAFDEWSSPGFTFTHNLVYAMGPGSTSASTHYIYAVRMTNGITGTRTVTYNEFRDLYPATFSQPYYTQLQVIGLRTPGGTINVTNNLIHHIKPAWAKGYCEQVGYAFYNNTTNTGTYNFSNNTVDNLDFSNGDPIGYALYCYFNSYTNAAPVSRSNIISTYVSNSGQYPYGYYHNYNGVLGVQYCDAYKIGYQAWVGFTNMTGNIEEDPEYENNTSEPYDYHLQSGSPCEGTGYNSEDMGCYGNMAAGETIVGIVTPE